MDATAEVRTMRPTSSQSMLCAALQNAAAKTNNNRADRRDILRPKVSENTPQMGVVAVLATI